MDLRQLRYFVALAETLNFRRAAERLHISQPPLTVAIRKLEEDLGAPLFTRSSRGVGLTPAGEAALELARGTLLQADQVRQAVIARANAERGRLTLGFVSAAYSLLPRLLPLFQRRYPWVELILEEATSAEIVRRIRSRQMDVGLVRLPLLDPGHVETSVIETDELVAAVPESHPLARQRTVPLRIIADEPFISYPRGDVVHAAIVTACTEAGFTPRVAHEVAQGHIIVSLVQCGLGVGLVPEGIRYVPDGVKLVRLDKPLHIEMGLVVPHATLNQLTASTRSLALSELRQGPSNPPHLPP